MKFSRFFLLMSFVLLFSSVKADSLSVRDYWMCRYLSVSFPLRDVKVSSSFGMRTDPFTKKKSFHNGLDLQAHYEEVYSMFDGTVIKTGSDDRSGRFVTMSYGNFQVSFCHLAKINVREGDILIAGDCIGVSGNSGRSTGPHLHITSRRNGEYSDPYNLLLYIEETRSECMKVLGFKQPIDSKGFIDRYADTAMRHQRDYGIPSSVTLAQMAFESGWGQSELALKGNNFFGIKCSRKWLMDGKPYSVHDDDRKGEKFCNYSSAEESMEHHSRLLLSERYKTCRRYSPTDYHGWLVALKRAGYATDNSYIEKCENIIRRYKLYEYDHLALKS